VVKEFNCVDQQIIATATFVNTPVRAARSSHNKSMCGALLLGLFCGAVARMLIPGDAFRGMSGPKSWLVSIGLGLLGALVGYLIFTVIFGIGDKDIFDWGGVLSALIGTLIVVPIAGWFLKRSRGTA
jgi:uncharacterized membrane protein YeaQ/YmgE (transglycosylase-associated protein family)